MRMTKVQVLDEVPEPRKWPQDFADLADAATGTSTARVPRVLSSRFEPSADDGFPVGFAIEVEVHVEDGAPVVRRVVFDAIDAEESVTPENIKFVRIPPLVDWVYGEYPFASVRIREGAVGWTFAVTDEVATAVVADVRRAKRVTITDDLLREVARVYSDNMDHAPTGAVARHFNKPKKTAERWIALARDPEKGFLPPTSRGRARGMEDAE